MNYIVSCLFTTCQDPLRPISWASHLNIIDNWYKTGISVCEKSDNLHLLIFYDEVPEELLEQYVHEHVTFIQVPACGPYSPHDYRWFIYKTFVEENYDDLEYIFFTDISDVLIKNNPFLEMDKGTLYVGDEMQNWDNEWVSVRNYYLLENLLGYEEIFKQNKQNTFLNAGLAGGYKEILLTFLQYMQQYIEKTLNKPYDTTDMLTFNYVIYKHFPNRKHGAPVNSLFWKNEHTRDDVWFVHK